MIPNFLLKKSTAGQALLALAVLTPLAANAGERAVVVTFGDSTTAPRGEVRIYSQILSDEIEGIQVINSGVPGNTTDRAKARFEKDVRAHEPDLVVIQFGINDSAVDVWKDPPATRSRVSLEDYAANLSNFVDRLIDDGATVILMTPNPIRWSDTTRKLYGKPPYDPSNEDGFSQILKLYAEKTRELAAQRHLPLVDVDRLFEAYGSEPGHSLDELLLDGMHPNDRGHQMVADALVPLVKERRK